MVSAYLHAGPAPSLGRMGSLLTLESSGSDLRCDALANCPAPRFSWGFTLC